MSRESSFLKTDAYPPFFQPEGQWLSLIAPDARVEKCCKGCCQLCGTTPQGLRWYGDPTCGFFKVEEGPAPTFCPMLSRIHTWQRKPETTGTQARARLKHMSAKALVLQAFHLGESREVTREQNAKKSVLSHLVSFATNGELELGFRGKLTIGTRRGGGLYLGGTYNRIYFSR